MGDQPAEPDPHPFGRREPGELGALDLGGQRAAGRVEVGPQQAQEVEGRGAQRPGADQRGNLKGGRRPSPAGISGGQPGDLLASRGDDGVAHAQRHADPLAHQLLVGLAGRTGQRVAQQAGTQVGVLDALARPAPQPGPPKARVQLLDRQPRVGVAPLTQPTAQRALGVWAPYWRYEVPHALCGAHLLRELEEITQEPGQGWAAGMAELLVDAKLACDRARAAGFQRVDDDARARLHTRYARLLADGQAANPSPPVNGRRPGRPRRSPAARLLARLDTHREEVLRSLDDTRVPFDNNQAERDLRMVKLQQKISGCWRTPAGAEAFLALRGYLSTARKHSMNPLAVLGQLFEGRPWLPAAAPGPPPAPPCPA
jgi:hypothetical protein